MDTPVNYYERNKWRGGQVAVYRGVPYRFWTDRALDPVMGLIPEVGDPAPDGLAEGWSLTYRACGYLVDWHELDAAFSWQWYFDWRGEEFRLAERKGAMVYGNVLRNFTKKFLDANGLKMYDRLEAGGWIPEADIENLHEERTDLLAQWKERHGE